MVLRDSNGGVIFSAYRSLLNCNEALEAEISAIMEGMSLALEWSNEAVTIHTDCAVALAALKEPMKNRSQYGHMIDEVKRLMSLRDFSLMKIVREQNRVANCLANKGRSGGSTTCWLHQIPDCISRLVLAECNPVLEE